MGDPRGRSPFGRDQLWKLPAAMSLALERESHHPARGWCLFVRGSCGIWGLPFRICGRDRFRGRDADRSCPEQRGERRRGRGAFLL